MQLVGEKCVICSQVIKSIIDGRFCERCDSSVHNRCTSVPSNITDPNTCPVCGATGVTLRQPKPERLQPAVNTVDAQECPACQLVSPGSAPACECGYVFNLSGEEARRQLVHAAFSNMVFGVISCCVGILLTLISYFLSSSLSRVFYFVYWGAIVFGAIRFFRGLDQRRKAARIK